MKPALLFLLLALAALPGAAQDSSSLPSLEIRGWFGQAAPNAHSDFWETNFQNFTAGRGQLRSATYGLDGIYHFDRYNAVIFSGNYYSTSFNETARTLRDDAGNPLVHHLDLFYVSMTAGYLFFPAGTDKHVVPYLGAGAGLYYGLVESLGDDIPDCTDDDCSPPPDCNPDCSSTFSAALKSAGTASATDDTGIAESRADGFNAFGYYLEAGLEVPISPSFAFLVDGRYTVLHTNLADEDPGYRHLDLSGPQVTAGLSFRF